MCPFHNSTEVRKAGVVIGSKSQFYRAVFFRQVSSLPCSWVPSPPYSEECHWGGNSWVSFQTASSSSSLVIELKLAGHPLQQGLVMCLGSCQQRWAEMKCTTCLRGTPWPWTSTLPFPPGIVTPNTSFGIWQTCHQPGFLNGQGSELPAGLKCWPWSYYIRGEYISWLLELQNC